MQKKLNSHQIGTGRNPTRVDCSSCISGHASGDVRHQGGGYSTPKREEKGYNSYLGIGADLIKYYDYSGSIYGRNPEDFYSIEYDVKTLLWLSRVNLGRKIK